MEQIAIEGWLYSTQSSERQQARMLFSIEGKLRLETRDDSPVTLFNDISIDECVFSDRIGSTPRFVSHSEFGRFEAKDNDSVDYALRHYLQRGQIKQGLVSRLAYRLESSLRVVLLTVCFTVLTGFLFVRYGMPWGAEKLAYALPEEVVREFGSGGLELLDELWFAPSKLAEAEQNSLRGSLLDIAQSSGVNNVKVEFRYSEEIGANAFALPDGTIVFMDGMVELASSDNELAAIMLHELGHVEYRHSMRSFIQQSGLGVMVLLAIGDVSAVSQVAIALPTLLVNAHYSREMEREADEYAYQRMRASGLDPSVFADIMRRVMAKEAFDQHEPTGESGDSTPSLELASWFSTHPDMEQRLQRFE